MIDPDTWYRLDEVARAIDARPITLRRLFGRHAVRTPEGVVARANGMVARKVGRTWRVQLGTWAPGRSS